VVQDHTRKQVWLAQPAATTKRPRRSPPTRPPFCPAVRYAAGPRQPRSLPAMHLCPCGRLITGWATAPSFRTPLRRRTRRRAEANAHSSVGGKRDQLRSPTDAQAAVPVSHYQHRRRPPLPRGAAAPTATAMSGANSRWSVPLARRADRERVIEQQRGPGATSPSDQAGRQARGVSRIGISAACCNSWGDHGRLATIHVCPNFAARRLTRLCVSDPEHLGPAGQSRIGRRDLAFEWLYGAYDGLVRTPSSSSTPSGNVLADTINWKERPGPDQPGAAYPDLALPRPRPRPRFPHRPSATALPGRFPLLGAWHRSSIGLGQRKRIRQTRSRWTDRMARQSSRRHPRPWVLVVLSSSSTSERDIADAERYEGKRIDGRPRAPLDLQEETRDNATGAGT